MRRLPPVARIIGPDEQPPDLIADHPHLVRMWYDCQELGIPVYVAEATINNVGGQG